MKPVNMIYQRNDTASGWIGDDEEWIELVVQLKRYVWEDDDN